MAKKNIFDLYNEQNPQTPSTDDGKLARRDEDVEREKVVQKETKEETKTETKAEPANAGDEKKEETKAEPADAGNNDKGGVDNGTV